MTKIPNWTRDDTAGPPTTNQSWIHDITGEVVWISEKVPNDGYYVMRSSAEESRGRGFGSRIGYDPSNKHAYKQAITWMRNNPKGYNG